MQNLNDVTADDFVPFLKEEFVLASPEGELRFTLIEVTKLGASTRAGGAFSLLWQGPTEPALEQAIYRISHAKIGPQDMFLVPIARQTLGVQYEAIFN